MIIQEDSYNSCHLMVVFHQTVLEHLVVNQQISHSSEIGLSQFLNLLK